MNNDRCSLPKCVTPRFIELLNRIHITPLWIRCVFRQEMCFLLQDYHLSCGGVVTCGQAIEVDAACDRFTQSVFSVPIDCL